MVCNVLGEYNERNGNVCNRDCSEVGPERAAVAEVIASGEGFDECEIGIPFKICELAEVDYFKRFDIRRVADYRKYCRKKLC